MGALQQQQQDINAEQSKMDTASAAASADPNVTGAPATVQGGVNIAREQTDETPSGGKGPDEEATPEEQKSYEKAMKAIQTVIYDNEESAGSIAEMLQPTQKIDSTVQAVLTTLSEVDKQIDMDEGVVVQVSMDLTDRIMDIGTEGKGIEYSDNEAKAVWKSVWEGVMNMYGIDEDEYASFTKGMSDADIKGQEQQYKQITGA